MTCLNKIRDALLTVSTNVGHMRALKKSPPYIVWAEDGQAAASWAGNRMQQQAVTGTVDLFTRVLDEDPLVDGIQSALNGVCSWRLNSVQYEDETGLKHWEWVFEIGNDHV